MTPTVGTSLSNRAINVITRALFGQFNVVDHRDEIVRLTRRGLRLRLHATAVQRSKDGPFQYDIRKLLMATRTGGAVTVNEILTWLDLHTMPAKPHECVCRTCGRKFDDIHYERSMRAFVRSR